MHTKHPQQECVIWDHVNQVFGRDISTSATLKIVDDHFMIYIRDVVWCVGSLFFGDYDPEGFMLMQVDGLWNPDQYTIRKMKSEPEVSVFECKRLPFPLNKKTRLLIENGNEIWIQKGPVKQRIILESSWDCDVGEDLWRILKCPGSSLESNVRMTGTQVSEHVWKIYMLIPSQVQDTCLLLETVLDISSLKIVVMNWSVQKPHSKADIRLDELGDIYYRLSVDQMIQDMKGPTVLPMSVSGFMIHEMNAWCRVEWFPIPNTWWKLNLRLASLLRGKKLLGKGQVVSFRRDTLYTGTMVYPDQSPCDKGHECDDRNMFQDQIYRVHTVEVFLGQMLSLVAVTRMPDSCDSEDREELLITMKPTEPVMLEKADFEMCIGTLPLETRNGTLDYSNGEFFVFIGPVSARVQCIGCNDEYQKELMSSPNAMVLGHITRSLPDREELILIISSPTGSAAFRCELDLDRLILSISRRTIIMQCAISGPVPLRCTPRKDLTRQNEEIFLPLDLKRDMTIVTWNKNIDHESIITRLQISDRKWSWGTWLTM